MKIYLIRHGQTTGDIENRYGGDYDDELSKKGREQAEKLADKIKNKKIEIIYCSSRIRARQTAEIVAETLKTDKMIVHELRERNAYGVLTGLTKAEAKEKYPLEVKELESKGNYHKVKGSERYEQFKERIMTAFENLIKNKTYHTIAIITHGGPIRCILRGLFGKELENLRDCAMIELEKKNGKLALITK